MYITKNEYLVTPTRGAEFEAWYTRFVEAVKLQSGFEGGLLLNSLGYPTRYIYGNYPPIARKQDLVKLVRLYSYGWY